MPVLVLAGSQDLRTPAEDARRVADLFPRGRMLEVPRVGHSVVGTDASGCAAEALRDFLEGDRLPGRCDAGAALRPTPLDPVSLRRVHPAHGTHGRPGRTLAAVRRTYQDALRPFFDLLAEQSGGEVDLLDPFRYSAGGLRGGRSSMSLAGARLDRLVYVPGVRVSGRLKTVAILPDGRLTVRGRAAAHGVLRVRDGVMSGRLGGRKVHGTLGPDVFDLVFRDAFGGLFGVASSAPRGT